MEQGPQGVVLKPRGELLGTDGFEVPAELIEELLGNKDLLSVVLDLSLLRALGAISGTGVLALKVQLAKAGKRLILAHPSEAVRADLQRYGLLGLVRDDT